MKLNMLIDNEIRNLNNMRHTIYEHKDWYYFSVNEKLHYFEGNKESEYRQIIKRIINRLLYDKPDDYNIRLYTANNNTYNYYEFLMPFASIQRMNIIDKLKIYIRLIDSDDTISTEEFYILADDENFNETDYEDECLPLFQSNGTHITVMSIVISVVNDSQCINTLSKSLPHELRHALDYIGNKKLADITNTYASERDSFSKLNPISSQDRRLIQLAENCNYYCQDTEIDAHIETSIVEANLCNLERQEFLNILRDYRQYDKLPDHIQNTMVTFYNYKFLLDAVNSYLCYSQIQYANIRHMTNKIISIIYPNSKVKTFKDVLLYWKSQLEKYFYRLGQIVYDQY